jgi:dolichol-phosphate mannosyltransferase
MKDYIVIPTFNERRNIGRLVPRIFELLPEAHVLVVDDSSPDGTQNVVLELAERYPNLELYAHNQKDGFAQAYIDAFKLLLGRENELRSIVMMDADLSHDPSYLPSFYGLLERYDVVIGSRYIPGGGVIGWEWWRMMLSNLGNIYLRAISGLKLRDITGGYNLISADLLRRIDLGKLEARGYAFQFVLKYHLLRAGARCIESSIQFRNRVEGESKLTSQIVKEALIIPWRLRIMKK